MSRHLSRSMKAMKPHAANLLLAVVLAGVLALLVHQTRATDEAAHNALLADIRTLKQIDAEWNADVLRARVGLSDNYDRIVSPLPAIRRLEVTVDSGLADAGLKAAFSAYRAAMDRKVALIEQFKSQNAILRNSTRFLPVAVDDVEALPRDVAAPGAVVADVKQAFADLMTLGALPDAPLLSRIEGRLAALPQQAAAWPAAARAVVEVFVSHARMVLRQQQLGVQTLAQIDALPTAGRIDEFTDRYLQLHAEGVAAQQAWRLALVAYSAGLLLLVAYVGWRLVRSLRRIAELSQAALKDVTVQLDEAQLQLVQSAKMSALGQMVAGIAHEINTPLAFVKGAIDVVTEHVQQVADVLARCDGFLTRLREKGHDKQLLRDHYWELQAMARALIDDGIADEASTLLGSGSRGIEQISAIVLNLKNFSRLDRAKVSDFDLHEGIESTLMLARHFLKNKVEVVRVFGDLPKVQCSPSQINQVLLNIVSNAAQAIADTGTLTLRTSRENAGTVRIDIEDDGAGIPPEVLPKIFDPFFTTKGVGKGTGMGLSISFKIIEQHGGRITVSSEPGIGTVFSILLPVTQPMAEASAARQPALAMAH